MGFAEEIRAASRGTPKPVTEVPPVAPETPAVPAAAAPGPLEHGHVALSQGAKPVEAVPEVATPPPATAESSEPAKPKVRIAGQEFDSVEAALAYAEKLEVASRQDAAFKEGLKAAQPAPPPEKALEERVEELIFENPKEAVRILRDAIKSEIFTEYKQDQATKAKELALSQARENAWTSFAKDNPELSAHREFAEFVFQKNFAALKDLTVDKGMPKLAEMVRKELKISKEAALPRKEMPAGPANVLGTGGNATAGKNTATQQEVMDFVTQVNQLRKRAAK